MSLEERRLPLYDRVNDFRVGTISGDAIFNRDVWETFLIDPKGISSLILQYHHSEFFAIMEHKKIVDYLRKSGMNYGQVIKQISQREKVRQCGCRGCRICF